MTGIQADTFVQGPYPGLVPYQEDDAWRFFGRERERDIIIANLRTWPITILHGPSGVGKSSVLNAGVVHALRRLSVRREMGKEAPRSVVVMISRWEGDPWENLLGAAERALLRMLPGARLRRLRFDNLHALAERFRTTFLVVFDQFEEYFVYETSGDHHREFASRLADATAAPGNRIKFLLSVREDALAWLDRLKPQIPNLFTNTLRLDYLAVRDGRHAITAPLAAYGDRRLSRGARRGSVIGPEEGPVDIEPDLVDDVLKEIVVGRVSTGAGPVTYAEPAAQLQPEVRVETAYLQLVMARLWSEEAKERSPKLRRATFEQLGGAQRIVSMHLDETMKSLSGDEQGVAAAVFHHLVTPSGTKIAYTIADLSAYTGISHVRLESLFTKLSHDLRIIRPLAPGGDRRAPPRFEIYHDALAPAILDWRARYFGRGVKWTANIEQLLQEWLRRVSMLSAIHQKEARRMRVLSSALPSAALSLLAATVFLRVARLLPAAALYFLMAGVALLLAGELFLRLPERAERHRLAAARYLAIRREIENTLALRPELRVSDPKQQLDRLREQLDVIALEAPEMRERAWARSAR